VAGGVAAGAQQIVGASAKPSNGPMVVGGAAAKMPSSAAGASKQDCPTCKKPTPTGFTFCQHCGNRLPPPAAASSPTAANPPAASAPASAAASATPALSAHAAATATPEPSAHVAPTPRPTPRPAHAAPAAGTKPAVAAKPSPTHRDAATTTAPPAPPAAIDDAITTPGLDAAALEKHLRPKANVTPQPQAPAKTIPVSIPDLGAAADRRSGDRRAPAGTARADDSDSPAVHEAVTAVSSPPSAAPAPAASAQPPNWRLIAMGNNGKEGKTYALDGDSFSIGRSEGDVVFSDDVYLAARQCRLERDQTQLTVVDLGAPNGVYVSVAPKTPLQDGDWILLGHQVLRFERIEEEAPGAASEHGVRILGSTVAPAWGRLRQITEIGTTHDVIHLSRTEIIVGRNQGDVRFPADKDISDPHAAIRLLAGQTMLTDLCNHQTFLRVRGKRTLQQGDVLRVGSQVLRIEL
jgi:uncharacterized Zn finger protein (UPF0148 family)